MKIIFLLILLVFQNSFASQESISIKDVEKIFLDEIKNEKSSDEDKFLLFNLAGRELYNYKYFDKSKEYYEKAIGLRTSQDSTEAYINLMAIEHAKSKEISKRTYDRAMDYFKKSKKISDDGIKRYMEFIYSNFIDKNGSKKFEGFYGEFSKQNSIKKLIEEKKYKEALSLINTKNIEERDFVTKIRYDLLRSIVLGKKNLSLSCKSKLDKYPDSIAWTIEACKTLVSYQKGKTPSKADFKRIVESAKEQRSSSQYLVQIFGDLK